MGVTLHIFNGFWVEKSYNEGPTICETVDDMHKRSDTIYQHWTDRENSHNSIVVGVTHILTLWFLPNLSHCIFSGVLTGILAVCLVAAWLLIKYSALSTQQLVIASAKWCVELERVA